MKQLIKKVRAFLFPEIGFIPFVAITWIIIWVFILINWYIQNTDNRL